MHQRNSININIVINIMYVLNTYILKSFDFFILIKMIRFSYSF